MYTQADIDEAVAAGAFTPEAAAGLRTHLESRGQLPAVDEDGALIRLEQLDQSQRILELGFERIDLRDPSVVAVRPRDGALPGQLVANGV